MRWLKGVALFAVVGLSLAAGVLELMFRSSVPPVEEVAKLDGLQAPVDIKLDAAGVPKIEARSTPDALFALGHLHGRNRAFQMDFLRRVAAGRLSEILGSDLLPTDRFMRTLGLHRLAERDLGLLSPQLKGLLKAYAAGVSSAFAMEDTQRAPELVLLRAPLEPWSAADSLAVAKIMAFNLVLWESELDVLKLASQIGEAKARYIKGLPPQTTTTTVTAAPAGLEGVQLGWAWLRSLSIARASNAWVIGSGRSASGKPIVANDMHLELNAPSTWYLATLSAPGLQVSGLTVPGIPWVIAGRTSSVAWGFTAASADEIDLFLEHPVGADKVRGPNGQPEPIVLRKEMIKLSNGEHVEHIVRSTPRGPIISDLDKRSGNRMLSMAWCMWDASTAIEAFWSMNRASTAEEFRGALQKLDFPVLNVLFADAEGEIGYQLAGALPRRSGGDPRWMLDASNAEHAWRGRIPFEDLPRLANPPSGVIVSANQEPQGRRSKEYLGSQWSQTYRARRISERLQDQAKWSVEATRKLQMDDVDLWAKRLQPLFAASAAAADAPQWSKKIKAWDARMHQDSVEAGLFQAWFGILSMEIFDDEGRGLGWRASRQALVPLLFGDAKDEAALRWIDDVRTPEKEDLVQLGVRAFRTVLPTMEGSHWGEHHHVEVRHPLGSVLPLELWLDLNLGPFEWSGSWDTISASGVNLKRGVVAFGASERHIVDLAETGGHFILPGGQSGHPRSPWYRDQLARWKTGELLYLDLLSSGRAAKPSVWTLKPAHP